MLTQLEFLFVKNKVHKKSEKEAEKIVDQLINTGLLDKWDADKRKFVGEALDKHIIRGDNYKNVPLILSTSKNGTIWLNENREDVRSMFALLKRSEPNVKDVRLCRFLDEWFLVKDI